MICKTFIYVCRRLDVVMVVAHKYLHKIADLPDRFHYSLKCSKYFNTFNYMNTVAIAIQICRRTISSPDKQIMKVVLACRNISHPKRIFRWKVCRLIWFLSSQINEQQKMAVTLRNLFRPVMLLCIFQFTYFTLQQ